jgi:hypothetical protein
MPRINILSPVKFECQPGCSNCCKSGGVVFIAADDVTGISKFLKISEAEFLKKYTRRDGKKIYLIDQKISDCIFLKDDKCSIYPVRPLQCKTFPFWPQNVKSAKRWEIVMQECPGIGKGKEFSKQEIKEILNGQPVNSVK